MTNAKFGNLGVLTGIRFERTDTAGHGPLNQLTAAERARRTAWGSAPVTDEEGRRRALAEWGTRVSAKGSYEDFFPGAHLTYALKRGLVARLSYSTSVGRPPITSIIPNTAVDDVAQTVTIANTGLKPQFSDNFDFNVEYYFEPIGVLSASVFLKEVKDFIFSSNRLIVPRGPDNGFDGLYEGYRLSTTLNGGAARYRGVEFSYQQQFTFLPGFWRGFGLNANFTYLETKGDYGGTVATTQVAGFRPKQANVAINYQIRKYRASVQANWVDDYLLTVAANPAQIVYEKARLVVNTKLTYDLSPRTSVYLNLDNLTRSPINSRYYTLHDRIGYTRLPFRSIAAGVQGRF
jgi:TonB-dependent receptor